MALSYRAASYVATGGGSGDARLINAPTGGVTADAFIFVVYWESDTNTVTPPAGVVSLYRQVNTGLYMVEVFVKPPGTTAAADYTFTPANNGQWRAIVAAAYSGGTGTGTLLDVAGGSQGDGITEAAQSAPSVTTTGTDRMLIRGGGNYNADVTSCSGAASNFRGGSGGASITDALRASAGATGTTLVSGAGDDNYVGIHVAIISDTGGAATTSIPPPRAGHRQQHLLVR